MLHQSPDLVDIERAVFQAMRDFQGKAQQGIGGRS